MNHAYQDTIAANKLMDNVTDLQDKITWLEAILCTYQGRMFNAKRNLRIAQEYINAQDPYNAAKSKAALARWNAAAEV